MDKISTLHPKGDLTTNIYPNIVADNIPSGAITADKIASKTITNSELADRCIDNLILGIFSVETENIANLSVTTEKIDNRSITTDKIADGAINEAKLDPSVTSLFTKHLYSLQFNISNTYVTIFTNYAPKDETLPLNENILLFNADKTMACTESVKNAIINISNYCFDGILTVSTDATVTSQRFYNNTQLEVNGSSPLRIDLRTFVCGENTGYEVYLKVKELA